VRFRIVHAFEIGTETTFENIAETTGISLVNIRRLLRHAILHYNVFYEPRPGVVGHTALSELMAKDDILHDWLSVALDEFWPAGVKERCA
jgi:hypothetical protein